MALPQGSGFHYSLFLIIKLSTTLKETIKKELKQTVQSLTQVKALNRIEF